MSSYATSTDYRGDTAASASPNRMPMQFLLSAGAGAALMYLFDPERGRSRRAMLRDRTMGTVHRLSDRVGRAGRRVSSEVYGIRQKVTHMHPEDTEIPNDPDLVERVETELFGDPEIPKGAININAEDGRIVLRGQIDDPAMMRMIERRVGKVHGVREVENLMHLPGTPAPNKEDALRASHHAEQAV